MAGIYVLEKTYENSGNYVIASSRPPERRPLERRTLVPIKVAYQVDKNADILHKHFASEPPPTFLENDCKQWNGRVKLCWYTSLSSMFLIEQIIRQNGLKHLKA